MCLCVCVCVCVCVCTRAAGNFHHVIVDKDCFRLRQNTRKKVSMTIFPSPSNIAPLNIQRYILYACTIHCTRYYIDLYKLLVSTIHYI